MHHESSHRLRPSESIVPSAWIERRGDRWRVRYRIGGRETEKRYGGSFQPQGRRRDPRRWIDGELAACRIPDLTPRRRGR